MAEAVVSVVVERVTAIIEEQIQNEVSLVRGVEEEVLQICVELEKIRNELDDAERRRFNDRSVKNWLKKLEDTSDEMEEVLDEWNYAILKLKRERESNEAVVAPTKQKVCSFIPSSCLCFKKGSVRHDISRKIEIVKEKLDRILAGKHRYNFAMSQLATNPSSESWRFQNTSWIDLAEVHRRDKDRDNIVRKLVLNGDSNILSIVGLAGIGKTTLAQLVYNDSQVIECFQLRIWIYVSDAFDEVEIAKGIIASVRPENCQHTNKLEILLQNLRDSILGKKFLLVLDDVWTDDYTKWEPLKNSLKCGGVGSKILVTTRNERVAKMMGTRDSEICHLGQLSDEGCWLLLYRMALAGRDEEEFEKFQDIGKKIASKCKGLPLAAMTLGRLLRFRYRLEEWENVLNSELWQLEVAEVDLFPHFLLTYNELPPALKRCFSYCAVFPKDYKIDVKKLIEIWIALGYLSSNIGSAGDMELKGLEYFELLAMQSLFQDFERDDLNGRIKMCKMHDIVHDFAQFVRKNDSVEATQMKEATCQVCTPLLVSSVKEYRSLFWDKEPPPNFCVCLTSLRVLGIRCKLRSIPQGVENLIHLRWLDFSYNEFSGEDLKAIGNLILLTHLDLSFNKFIKELPESICGLHELKSLNIDACSNLCGLPEAIHRLTKLEHLHNQDTSSLKQFPQGLAKLTGLRTLKVFRGGSGWSKLGWLKNLNCLHGSLTLWIRLTNDWKDVVEDARQADLTEKMHIQNLEIIFFDYVDERESSVWMDVINALKPHPNLKTLEIWNYMGSKLPGWIASPLNQIRYIKLHCFNLMKSLPPLGKLPCLEELCMSGMYGLQSVRREFLGTTTAAARDTEIESSSSSSSTYTIGFPKLRKLTFRGCPHWKKWKDITAKEEESAAVPFMPCLTELTIQFCKGLKALPHRLLSKASSLEMLDISYSTQLQQLYRDKDGSAWKSISQNNPRLQLKLWPGGESDSGAESDSGSESDSSA